MFTAYSTFAPVVLHYRWLEWKQSSLSILNVNISDKDWEDLDDIYATYTVEKLGRLQGMYSKYGQTAAGLSNTLGDKWVQELRTLENEIPPRPAEEVYQTIEEETGGKVFDTFSYFDPVPLGSASIGQVHRAILRKDGREVAVKVQYPEAHALFHDDIKTIRKFCELFAPEQVCTMDALEKQNKEELDYIKEAENLLEVSVNMKKHGFFPSQVVVPQPLMEHTTKRLLVMELLPGPKLADGMRAYYSTWAEQNGTTLKELEKEARDKIETDGIPDKYSGPSDSQIVFYRRWLYLQDAVANGFIRLYNHLPSWKKKDATPYRKSSLPPNTPRIIDTLMRVHGCQLLLDGVFSSDPHGGNFLLLPDGRIGLIDYGATKRLTETERLTACVLFSALARQDKEKLCLLSEVGGYKSKYNNNDVLYKLLQFAYDSWGNEVTGGKNVQQFMDDLKETDPWYETPDNFVLASFMSVRLRALALGMNHPVKCSDWWGNIAEEELKKQGLPYETWDREQLIKYKPDLNIHKYDVG